VNVQSLFDVPAEAAEPVALADPGPPDPDWLDTPDLLVHLHGVATAQQLEFS
jgi:hypothetical protein